MRQPIFVAFLIISAESAFYTTESHSCRSCEALQKCEVVLSVGVHSLNAKGSVLDCNGYEIECKTKPDKTHFWTPFDPCEERLGTTEHTEAPSLNVKTTNTSPLFVTAHHVTENIPLYSHVTSADVFLPNSDGLTSTIATSKSSAASPLNETASSKYDSKRGTGWLATTLHLKVILWILLPFAVILLFTGLISLVVLLLYQRRRKGRLHVRRYQRNHKDGYESARTHGIIAYETPSNTGLSYEKLQNRTHYYVQRNASIPSGTVGNMLATNSNGATPHNSIRYHAGFNMSREQLEHTTECLHNRPLNGEFTVGYPSPHNAFQLITFASNDSQQEDIYKNTTPPGLNNYSDNNAYPAGRESNGPEIYLTSHRPETTDGDFQLSYSQENGYKNLQPHTTDFDGNEMYFGSFQSLSSFARDPVESKRDVT
ncbi:hypothetical protein SprV_0100284700 [Sparganum proliferum]